MSAREIAGRGGRGSARVVLGIVAALLVTVLLTWWLGAGVGRETALDPIAIRFSLEWNGIGPFGSEKNVQSFLVLKKDDQP